MTITEFRDTHQKDMHNTVLQAGIYLEAQGLLFGHDFVTGDALDLAAAFLTRKATEDYRDAEEDRIIFSRANRFQDQDWGSRYG